MGSRVSVPAPRGAGAFALRLIRTTPRTPKGVVVRGCGKRRIPPPPHLSARHLAKVRNNRTRGARRCGVRRDSHQDYQACRTTVATHLSHCCEHKPQRRGNSWQWKSLARSFMRADASLLTAASMLIMDGPGRLGRA